MTKTTDILIIGGGSAGFGAAYRALSHGCYHVTLVDKNSGLGGTSTFGGVNNWEPGYGGAGVHRQLAERLLSEGTGLVAQNIEEVTEETPWGLSVCSEDPYEETLERSFRERMQQRRFHFEPQAMADAMLDMLRSADQGGKLDLMLNTTAIETEISGHNITAVTVDTPDGICKIIPRIVLDCSGDIVIARAAGCTYSVGEDAQNTYQEPNAPIASQRIVNGITLVFRVTPCDPDHIDTLPDKYADVDLTEWLDTVKKTNRPLSCFNYYADGDININMLPTLPGESLLDLPEEEVRHIAEARVYAYWNWVQTKKNFRGYRIKEIFPMLGIRETYRLIGRYVLKEQDLRNGFSFELGPEHSIAFADHPADIHGKSNKKGGMTMFAPYGIPYECLLPNEISNLLVACRGASFSHIALSSVRLCRTMMAVGEAAGCAAVLALNDRTTPDQINLQTLRQQLGIR